MCSVGNKPLARAFTLVELLTTVALIAAFMVILLPAVKGLKGGGVSLSATTQLMADLHNARHLAIKNGTTVYVVFFPKWKQFTTGNSGTPLEPLVADYMKNVPKANRLLAGQLTAYAFYMKNTLGSQPGSDSSQWISDWKYLPEGSHLPANLFEEGRMDWATFPFLDNDSKNNPAYREAYLLLVWPQKRVVGLGLCLWLPYLGFDGKGRLVGMDGKPRPETTLTIAEGGILPPPVANNIYELQDADEKETSGSVSVKTSTGATVLKGSSSTHNRIKLSAFTGRCDRRAADKYDLVLFVGPPPTNTGMQNQLIDVLWRQLGRDQDEAIAIVQSVGFGIPAIILRDEPYDKIEAGRNLIERAGLGARARID